MTTEVELFVGAGPAESLAAMREAVEDVLAGEDAVQVLSSSENAGQGLGATEAAVTFLIVLAGNLTAGAIKELVRRRCEARGLRPTLRVTALGDDAAQEQGEAMVFVSHAREDARIAGRLALDLEQAGIRVWLDTRVMGVGDSIADRISQGLANADYVLALVSAASLASKWVRAEWAATLSGEYSDAGIVLLPARLDDAELPPLLRDKVHADFRHSYERGLASVIALIRRPKDEVPSPYSRWIGAFDGSPI